MNQQKSYLDGNGKLYLVPTPIGNLEDMTFRAIDTLKQVDLILAEDTRRTIKLLNHFEIKQPMMSFHEHSSQNQVIQLIDRLVQGENLALVSDAGMPLINDPGHPLVQAAIQHNISVIALPGANAAITALVASGLNAERFTYYGFFPRETKEQKDLAILIGQRNETAIFYESPFRLKKTVKRIAEYLSADTQIVLAREISKQYEEYLRGKLSEILEFLEHNEIKGEFVLLVEGGRGVTAVDSVVIDLELPLKEQVDQWIAEYGVSSKEAVKEVAKLNGLRKQLVYQAYHNPTDVNQ
ncbi:16S rRNA (cytidine(1402)-2'-O)-methyltransferase [Globicatella sulfidifaciens]|uniref:16S rRNA (cytidine(1402)-2'-O)-methyltransferase n=1 Tax=Globicatella sulfidifaciens TaxID=136093 RepID=UPI00288EDC97|nr:16S rRNA (cytidine(1402)-2'-O)-methyltransferase [Globicatella sulfidifaciens]MDT2768383.1 16S rRNA (cytidine(1402)-2'-O)-methyltransferase [Globicatella sulfidifaciens]